MNKRQKAKGKEGENSDMTINAGQIREVLETKGEGVGLPIFQLAEMKYMLAKVVWHAACEAKEGKDRMKFSIDTKVESAIHQTLRGRLRELGFAILPLGKDDVESTYEVSW